MILRLLYRVQLVACVIKNIYEKIDPLLFGKCELLYVKPVSIPVYFLLTDIM